MGSFFTASRRRRAISSISPARVRAPQGGKSKLDMPGSYAGLDPFDIEFAEFGLAMRDGEARSALHASDNRSRAIGAFASSECNMSVASDLRPPPLGWC